MADEIVNVMLHDPTFVQHERVVAGRETRAKRLQKWIEDAEGKEDDSPTNRLPAFQEAMVRVENFVNAETERKGLRTPGKWKPTFWIANCYRGTDCVPSSRCVSMNGDELVLEIDVML
jgi:hypothetical protein